MSVVGIRDGLKTALASTGLVVYHEAPAQVSQTPCAIVLPREGQYDQTLGGMIAHTFVMTLLVSLAGGYERAQATLDAYLAASGVSSVKAAVDADHTLGGACTHARVVRYYEYGGHEYGGATYLGCRLEVEVIE